MIELRQTERFARWLDLLAGGNKQTQGADIRAALRLARCLTE